MKLIIFHTHGINNIKAEKGYKISISIMMIKILDIRIYALKIPKNNIILKLLNIIT